MSPVQTPPKEVSTETRKKRSRRRRIESLAYADLGPGNGGFPIDVGEGGMAFQGIQPLEKDQIITVRFKLPGTDDVVETTGQIVWLNDLGKGGGLKFLDVSEECRDAINRWLASQVQPNVEEPKVSVAPQSKKKEAPKVSRSSAAPAPGNSASTGNANSRIKLPTPATATIKTSGSAPSKIPVAGIRLSPKSRAMFQAERGTRDWVRPFTIGAIVCVAFLIAALLMSGVISVQLRWPLSPGHVPEAPAANPTSATAPDSASGNASASMKPSTTYSVPDGISQDSSALTVPTLSNVEKSVTAPAD